MHIHLTYLINTSEDWYGFFSFCSILLVFHFSPLCSSLSLTYSLLHSCLCYGLFYILTIGIAIIHSLILLFLSFSVFEISFYEISPILFHSHYIILMFYIHLLNILHIHIF